MVVFVLGILGITIVYSLGLNGPPIRSDGIGYYLYLPAVFIHHDMTLQRIATEQFDGHIPKWAGVTMVPGTNNYLIKYPMGEALLMMPFFLLAYLISCMVGVQLDGFSFWFQYAAAISGLFYATLGLSILWDLLQKHFKPNTVLLVLSGLLFGTNLFHYATYDSIFSHAYSFFLFCVFLHTIDRVYSRVSLPYFILAGAVAGFIILTRPSNGLWLIFGVLYGVTSIESLLGRLQFLKSHTKECLLAIAALLGIISLQMIYWKTITGSAFILTYEGEHFSFLKPQIINVLFSVRKGLFFWSPILLTLIPGLFYLRKRAPDVFVPILVFFPLNIYIISCWHSWWYGASFGSRAVLESLPVFAFGLCSFYEGTKSNAGKRILVIYIVVCAVLSTWLMAKYWTGVIPFDKTSWSYFVKTFLDLRKTE